MHHLAILAKEKHLLAKIISGEKTIESRWYKHQKTPYNNIQVNDTIYFKESGEQVRIKAIVSKVLFFDNLNKTKIKQILKTYGKQIGITKSSISNLEDKNYCTLIFINKVKVIKPFNIDKTGYGIMSAWISVNNINDIRHID